MLASVGNVTQPHMLGAQRALGMQQYPEQSKATSTYIDSLTLWFQLKPISLQKLFKITSLLLFIPQFSSPCKSPHPLHLISQPGATILRSQTQWPSKIQHARILGQTTNSSSIPQPSLWPSVLSSGITLEPSLCSNAHPDASAQLAAQ